MRKEKTQVIVLGGEDGAVRLYQIPQSGRAVHIQLQPWKCLESKGGPIQSLTLHDVTKFGSIDVISGDSRGTMTILSNGQILDRRHLSDHSINSLQVDEDLAGNTAIVAGDSGGLLSAVLPFNDLWKLKLRPEDSVAKQPGTSQPSVKALLAFSGPSSSAGHVTNYILVCDDQNCLHILQQGTKVLTLSTPGPVTAMCSGIFQGSSGEIDQRFFSMKEVALGCHNGTIYIMKEFKILPQAYANIQLPIMHLRQLPSVRDDGLDSILCAGQFRAVLLLHNGQILSRYEVSDLVVTMETCKNDTDESVESFIGCRDKTLYSLKVT
ncbi:uncharacterized protein [Apostichopus japonicus]|uniref:uncharacterized protein isoform X2 n=1 Tax=Stichopus japonicus TaxID=307972 RepID=UPI003AB60624